MIAISGDKDEDKENCNNCNNNCNYDKNDSILLVKICPDNDNHNNNTCCINNKSYLTNTQYIATHRQHFLFPGKKKISCKVMRLWSK